MEEILSEILAELKKLNAAMGRIEKRLGTVQEERVVSILSKNDKIEAELDMIWAKAKKIMQKDISEISYKTWIETLRPYSASENQIIILAQTGFEKAIVEQRYYELIKSAFNQAAGKENSIVISAIKPICEKTVVEAIDLKHDKYHLCTELTFDSWVLGQFNELAYRGAVDFAQRWVESKKLLYLYGGPGLGKTHLINAIGNYILNNDPDMKISYISIDDFINGMINSIRNDELENFEKVIMDNDVLIIDNLQLIKNKERTQEEFWQLINKMLMQGKKIVIASTEAPEDTIIMKEKFASLFEISGVYKLEAPDLNTRIEILKKKTFSESATISNEVVKLIAQNVPSNVRQLINMGARVLNYARLTGQDIDKEIAMKAMEDFL
ncbi:DnaA ATPase domain-containing protein [Lutispora sp.]|uniref:DnaA ATPase domain-containing protein n=1 Tax=Lutispora sp. TaxID=2828727 RepID=UPI002B1FCE8F|nr:DnaA/Hda family protein [Lutispora sp.]MEA4961599.1 DnaA/Hda family protein [Lutispora sp.]